MSQNPQLPHQQASQRPLRSITAPRLVVPISRTELERRAFNILYLFASKEISNMIQILQNRGRLPVVHKMPLSAGCLYNLTCYTEREKQSRIQIN